MKQSIILGIGAGRCGLASLARILNGQPDVQCSYDEPPLLPWMPDVQPARDRLADSEGEQGPGGVVRARFARFRQHGTAGRLGDVASSYLPYVEEAIAAEPDIRIVCLKRSRDEVIASFCRWLDRSMPLPTNHWARQPADGWHHDLLRTRTFPQYDTTDREEGIGRYWDEYDARVDALVQRYPEHVRVFDMHEALNTEQGLRDLLGFAGIAPERQVLAVGTRVESTPRRSPRQLPNDPMDPRRCVILAPFATYITPPCERALVELERRAN